MFDPSTSHLIQLLIALLAGVVLFSCSCLGAQRILFKILIVIIPFQLINSAYGSLNMAMIYVIGAGMFINRSWIREKRNANPPLLWAFLLLIFSYLLSWFFASNMFWDKTLFYLIMLGSNVFLFYMSYYFVSNKEDFLIFFDLFLFCNILVIIYCIVQLFVGFQEFSFFGLRELSLQQNRIDSSYWGTRAYRVVGPFQSPGPMAEYLVIQCLLIGYYIIILNRYRKIATVVLFCNIAALIGTGNRGGYICFLVAFFLFIYLFRKNIGTIKLTSMCVVMGLFLISASYIMIKFTDFNVLYQRLLTTEFHGIIPDTRTGWSYVVERICDKPIFGHGPRLLEISFFESLGNLPKGEIGVYPHNLYLYILYTLGFVGFLAYGIFAIGYLFVLRQANGLSPPDSFLSTLPKLGMLIFFIFLLDQMKVEFLRPIWLDSQHYLSALFGMFLATKKVLKNEITPQFDFSGSGKSS